MNNRTIQTSPITTHAVRFVRKSDYDSGAAHVVLELVILFIGVNNMPQTKAQRAIFALLTVLITVHAYVFYSLYVVNGAALTTANNTASVLAAIANQGGILLLGKMVPIWAVVLIEFAFAFCLEMLIGSPLSFKLACMNFDPAKTHPVLFETAIVSATVGIMCPIMSFIAAILYYPTYLGFNFITLLANSLKLICFNFPFAWFSQLFFIQPIVRTIFKKLFH